LYLDMQAQSVCLGGDAQLLLVSTTSDIWIEEGVWMAVAEFKLLLVFFILCQQQLLGC
jgi:hypothetical protein